MGGQQAAECMGINGAVFGEHDRPLDDVLKFPDISGPGVGLQKLLRICGEKEGTTVIPLLHAFEKMLQQQDNIPLTFPQRRELQGEYIQPVIEILPEVPRHALLEQVAVGGRNDADIHQKCFSFRRRG